MTQERLMRRLRAANPVPTIVERAGSDHLFALIVAGPGDERLTLRHDHRFSRWITGTRRLAVGAAACLLVTASAAAAVIGSGVFAHATPVALFEANAGQHPALSGQSETVIPSTVQASQTFTVPGVGQVTLWTATTSQGGFCMALLLPGTTWAGFSASQYDTGYGSVGCQPTYAQVNQYSVAHGGKPVLGLDDGFQYDNAILRGSDGREWDIYYGRVIPTQGQPATVRDQISGISAPVTSDGWFAITVPMPNPPTTQPNVQFQALDSAGQVIAQEPSAASA
jgi:hypothetical protein